MLPIITVRAPGWDAAAERMKNLDALGRDYLRNESEEYCDDR
jgi:hypothetical protein